MWPWDITAHVGEQAEIIKMDDGLGGPHARLVVFIGGGLSPVILAVSLQATFLRADTPRSPPPWHVENLWIIVENPTTALQLSTPPLPQAICLWTAVDEPMGCGALSTGSQQGVFRLLRSKDPVLPTDSTGPIVITTKPISLIGTTSLPNVSVEYALLSGHGVRWPSALDLPS